MSCKQQQHDSLTSIYIAIFSPNSKRILFKAISDNSKEIASRQLPRSRSLHVVKAATSQLLSH